MHLVEDLEQCRAVTLEDVEQVEHLVGGQICQLGGLQPLRVRRQEVLRGVRVAGLQVHVQHGGLAVVRHLVDLQNLDALGARGLVHRRDGRTEQPLEPRLARVRVDDVDEVERQNASTIIELHELPVKLGEGLEQVLDEHAVGRAVECGRLDGHGDSF